MYEQAFFKTRHKQLLLRAAEAFDRAGTASAHVEAERLRRWHWALVGPRIDDAGLAPPLRAREVAPLLPIYALQWEWSARRRIAMEAELRGEEAIRALGTALTVTGGTSWLISLSSLFASMNCGRYEKFAARLPEVREACDLRLVASSLFGTGSMALAAGIPLLLNGHLRAKRVQERLLPGPGYIMVRVPF